LKLINPENDPTRNGIYWFFQNQLTNPAYDPVSIPPQQYYGCNITAVPQTNPIGKCSLNGIPSFYDPITFNPLLGNLYDYLYNISPIGGTYESEAPLSPQQFVYIPDIFQFPTSTIDLSGLWSYLENQFSINMVTLSGGSLTPALQKFRQTTSANVEFERCPSYLLAYCVKSYSAGDFPIQNAYEYQDTQFLSYLNIQKDMVTGVSSISPGCLQQATNFVSNIYNPIVSSNSGLLGTSAPLSQQTST
jgi:hypothetical protein